jgi:hypothetical protein
MKHLMCQAIPLTIAGYFEPPNQRPAPSSRNPWTQTPILHSMSAAHVRASLLSPRKCSYARCSSCYARSRRADDVDIMRYQAPRITARKQSPGACVPSASALGGPLVLPPTSLSLYRFTVVLNMEATKTVLLHMGCGSLEMSFPRPCSQP